MTLQLSGMLGAGSAVLVLGLILARARLRAGSVVDRLLALGPVLEASALAIFAAEHFLLADGLKSIVPGWLPWPLFWTYFFGVALLAAALSFITFCAMRWSAPLLALFFLTIVVTVDLPNLAAGLQDRLFWTLTVRETAFAGGALVLAGSLWRSRAGSGIHQLGRAIVAATLVFYGVEHFFFLRNVPGVPLEKMTPDWIPAAPLIAAVIGLIEVVTGPLLLVPRTTRIAAAVCGAALLLLVVFFYLPILLVDLHTERAIEGLNYVGDTLLFAATVLLAGRREPALAGPH